MGNSSSTPAPDSKMINESVYELYTPPGLGAPELEIIFIHGPHLHGALEDAFWRTWTTSENECWPQTWLTKEENLPTARILAVSYDASIRKSDTHGGIDLFGLAENMRQDLFLTHREGCPVFIVAHSLGGLVVNQMILLADKMVHRVRQDPETKTFLDDLAGIVYFATPHLGGFLRGAPIPNPSPLMELAHSLMSRQLQRLSEDFRHWLSDNRVRTLGFCEAVQTGWGPYFGFVVGEASARAYMGAFESAGEDHFGVCAPSNPGSSPALHRLTLFIKNVLAQQNVPSCQHLPQQIVGIDRAVEEVMAKLDNLEAISLGVVGKGGIGKTTLVKKVFNILIPLYDYSCFVHEVKNIEGGVEAVKKAILQHVPHRRKKIGSADGDLKSLLSRKRLLLVLDHAVPGNIIVELVSLLQHDINVDEGSRLVLTSRNTESLSVLGDRNIYPVPPLDGHFATRLFTTLAFPKSDAPASQLNSIVTKCEGLPLALEVLGNYLHEKSENIWEEAVRVLDKADNLPDFDERLWAKLRVSYDALKEEEQQMFLDAATIFNGCRLIEAKEVWNFTMKNAEHAMWDHLVQMSLVWEVAPMGRIEDAVEIRIGMHEHLQSLGRHMASEVGEDDKRSREKRGGLLHGDWNIPPVEWHEDLITCETMCDPVKCNDGRTYDRWTIIDHPNTMIQSPFNPAILKLEILVDDLSLRALLFHNFPEQVAKFDSRRRGYREAALESARALQSEDGKLQFQDAIKKLNNVLKWAPWDTECQHERKKILRKLLTLNIGQVMHGDWDLPPVEWHTDPLTDTTMCDPVKCNDGHTYDRWTLIDNDHAMSQSPYKPNLKLDILFDDISLRRLLFHKFPEQVAAFDDSRRDYRKEAVQNARALHSEDGKEQFQDAIKKLNNVLKWAPSDTQCQNELERIQNLLTVQAREVNRTRNFPTANIPVLNHSDVVRLRESKGHHMALVFVLIYICVSFFIT